MNKYITIIFVFLNAYIFAQKGTTIPKETTKPVTTTKDKTASTNPSGTVILTVDAALTPCVFNSNKQCLQVLRKGADAYETVEDIEGFIYDLGYTYTIQAKEILKTPPIGVNESLYRYKWIKTISKKEEGITTAASKTDETKVLKTNGVTIGETNIQVASPLDGTWYLRKMKEAEGSSFVTDDNIMFINISTFKDYLNGFGACNKFEAVVKSDLKTSFEVSKLTTLYANCGNKKIENLFYDLLQQADRFEIKNGNLILSKQWNYLLEFVSSPDNKEAIKEKYTKPVIVEKENTTYATNETITTTTKLDENKQPITTTTSTNETTISSDADEAEMQRKIDEMQKALEAKKQKAAQEAKKAEDDKLAKQKADEAAAKVLADKEEELRKQEELKQQELAAKKAKEEKLAKLKAEQERLQKEMEELDKGNAATAVASTPKNSDVTIQTVSTATSKPSSITTFNSSSLIHDIFSAPEIPVTYLGIDFSNAKYYGTLGIVTNTDLASMLKAINYVIPNEYDKYNIAKALKKENASLILQLTDNLNKNITDGDFVSYSTGNKDITLLNDASVKTIVSKYDFSKYEKGIGLIFIVDNMDKTNEQATAWVTFIDMNTNAVILTEKMTGKPGGFGFRNYWVKAFAEMIGDIKSKQFKKWKEKYETNNTETKSEATTQKASEQKVSEQKVMKDDDESTQKSKSGKCSFEKNEKDKFTGKRTILLRSLLFKEFTTRADIVFGLYDDTLYAVISYGAASPQVFEADNSSELWLSLSNEKVLKLKIASPQIGHLRTNLGGTESLINPSYFITKEELEILSKAQIIEFRFSLKQGNIRKEVDSKIQKKITSAANCLLNEL